MRHISTKTCMNKLGNVCDDEIDSDFFQNVKLMQDTHIFIPQSETLHHAIIIIIIAIFLHSIKFILYPKPTNKN